MMWFVVLGANARLAVTNLLKDDDVILRGGYSSGEAAHRGMRHLRHCADCRSAAIDQAIDAGLYETSLSR